MSNLNPNTSGINRYWVEGEDDRHAIEAKCIENRAGLFRKDIDAVLSALMDVIVHNRRTKIVGFGVFEWKPWNGRLPTGERVSTWSLTFKPCRHKERYNGDR